MAANMSYPHPDTDNMPCTLVLHHKYVYRVHDSSMKALTEVVIFARLPVY